MNLRLPAELHDKLRRAAFEDDRSLNSLIVRVLREWEIQRSIRADERKADRES